jgi:hypothetical protein
MIEATDLTRTYRDTVAVDHVTFTVRAGIVIGLLGTDEAPPVGGSERLVRGMCSGAISPCGEAAGRPKRQGSHAGRQARPSEQTHPRPSKPARGGACVAGSGRVRDRRYPCPAPSALIAPRQASAASCLPSAPSACLAVESAWPTGRADHMTDSARTAPFLHAAGDISAVSPVDRACGRGTGLSLPGRTLAPPVVPPPRRPALGS